MGSVIADGLFMLAITRQNRAWLADALIFCLCSRERRHHGIARRYIIRSTSKESPSLYSEYSSHQRSFPDKKQVN